MDPILRDFPESFETERLIVRAPRFGDGAELNAAVLETLDELRPWMPWAREAPTLEESEANLRNARLEFLARKDLRLNLHLKSDGTLVGGSGLHRIDWSVPRFEIGYWCRARFVGKGYVAEAVRAIAAFGLDTLGAKRVEIRCDSNNTRSRRVAERAGFVLEGELRNDALTPAGELRNTVVYAVTPADRARLAPPTR